MNVYIRVDASLDIGTGHVMRCLTLAERLREHGATVCFISREHKGHLCDFIEKKGYEVLRLPVSEVNKNIPNLTPHSQWLGVSLSVDITQTKQLLRGRRVNLLIIDHYAINEEWERAFRDIVDKIFVIDDLADRKHNCDFLLDQNYYENYQKRYLSLVPDSCKLFLGPSYVLLRNEFYNQLQKPKVRSEEVQRILIFFGGSDQTNETGKAIESFLELNRQDIHVDVVIGYSNIYKNEIASMCKRYEFLNFHCQVNNMAEFMSCADLSIGAGGTTTWERCFLGLPSIVVSIADNQEEICKTLGMKKIIKYIGKKEEVDHQIITRYLKELIVNNEERFQMSKLSYDLMKDNLDHQQMMIKELMR
jgi:UDP-2,4-diacetamido-2,4,6-trideoxy-beta-L-altropyranose hydrolase